MSHKSERKTGPEREGNRPPDNASENGEEIRPEAGHAGALGAGLGAGPDGAGKDTANQTENARALEIADHLLELTRQAYHARDFEVFRKYFIVPQVVGTFDGDRVIRTLSELREVYEAMLDMMAQRGVIDIKRRTIEARFLGPDRIQSTFISEYILPGYAISDEVVAHGTLRCVDGQWMVEESRYATAMDGVSKALMGRNASAGPGSPKA